MDHPECCHRLAPPARGGRRRGDLHVHLRVETPTKLDHEQQELLRQLAALREESSAQLSTAASEAHGGLFSRLKDAFTAK